MAFQLSGPLKLR